MQVAAGDAIQLKYGSHDNHNLLLSYGFVVPGNTHDRYTFQLDLDFILVGAPVVCLLCSWVHDQAASCCCVAAILMNLQQPCQEECNVATVEPGQ